MIDINSTADTVIVLDFETTGLSPDYGDRAIEIGAVKLVNGELVDRFQQLMNPHKRISAFIENYTGITNKMLKGTSINCLCPLRDLKRVAARREPQQNGYSILKAHNAYVHGRTVVGQCRSNCRADACFRLRPTGLYDQPRLCVALFRQAHVY